MKAPDLGTVDRKSLLYGRQDVRATWALFKALRAEYVRHPFATFANERRKPKTGRHMGQLYSSASIAKQYLRLLGIAPLLAKQPRFRRQHLGKGAASYFGGRADVRVRKLDLPVRVVDFTAMYASIFCLQGLSKLLGAPRIGVEVATTERGLLGQMASDNRLAILYDPTTWPRLNCLVLVDTNWAILPVRMRKADKEPYTIAVTYLQTQEGRWYTLADVLASVVLGGPAPKVRRAIRFVPKGRHRAKSTEFRGKVPMRSNEAFFKQIVEERQIAKREAKDDPDLAGLDMGLKQMAASGAYGIYAEINVSPSDPDEGLPGDVYSDISYPSQKVHDEKPGAFSNPILASLVTGGARLMLGMLECEVNRRGGTFAFCDTDSLAIVCGDRCPAGIPWHPTGLLRLRFENYFSVPIRREWNETEEKRLEDRLREILIALYFAVEAQRLSDEEDRKEAARRAAEEQRRWEREERERREREAVQKLLEEATNWEDAKRIRLYVRAMEEHGCKQSGWVEWALGIADRLDLANAKARHQ